MASHNNTPQSVLDAPKQRVLPMTNPRHDNRAVRRSRWGFVVQEDGSPARFRRPLAERKSLDGPRNLAFRGMKKGGVALGGND